MVYIGRSDDDFDPLIKFSVDFEMSEGDINALMDDSRDRKRLAQEVIDGFHKTYKRTE